MRPAAKVLINSTSLLTWLGTFPGFLLLLGYQELKARNDSLAHSLRYFYHSWWAHKQPPKSRHPLSKGYHIASMVLPNYPKAFVWCHSKVAGSLTYQCTYIHLMYTYILWGVGSMKQGLPGTLWGSINRNISSGWNKVSQLQLVCNVRQGRFGPTALLHCTSKNCLCTWRQQKHRITSEKCVS